MIQMRIVRNIKFINSLVLFNVHAPVMEIEFVGNSEKFNAPVYEYPFDIIVILKIVFC